MQNKTTTLYLVRHGTTALNDAMCLQGAYDEPLNEWGDAQGKCLTDYFKAIPIDIGVTSPLKRARQTLDYILGERRERVPIIVDQRLREIEGGSFEKRSFAELGMLWPGFMRTFKKTPGLWRFPGGESGAEVYARVVDGILDIVGRHQGKTIAMASHGFAIQTWLNFVSHIPAENMREQVLGNVAVSKFTFDDKMNIHTDYIGDCSHLAPRLIRNYDWDALAKPVPLLLGDFRARTFKKAEELLGEKNIHFLKRDIIQAPLSAPEIVKLSERHDGSAKAFLNTRGKKFRSLELKEKTDEMSIQKVAEIISSDGALLRQPILVLTDRIVIGHQKIASTLKHDSL